MRSHLFGIVAALSLGSCSVVGTSPAPYAGQEARDVKALSSEEMSGLLEGKGMGLAKAAELNGFAGPAHVLELASQLRLSADQKARTEVLFASMSRDARSAGAALIGKERELDRLFASKAITPERLVGVLTEIGELQSRVRNAHLQAHLAQVEILTPEQNAKYVELRGYSPHRH